MFPPLVIQSKPNAKRRDFICGKWVDVMPEDVYVVPIEAKELKMPVHIKTEWFRAWDRAAETNFWDYYYIVTWADGTKTETHSLRPEWAGVPCS
jgi:hypothetical protein